MTDSRTETTRQDDVPRNLHQERPHTTEVPPGNGPPATAREAELREGEVMRSEPAAARGASDPHEHARHAEHPEHHEPVHPGDGRPAPGDEADGERLIPRSEAEELRRRWDSIQASFIDEPRESVQEADHMVGELTDRITERFGSERGALEERWNRGEEVSTEALRQSLQRYRGFFDRLLRL